MTRVPKKTGRSLLAERVRNALRASWRECSDRQIAEHVNVSNRTVSNHRKILEQRGEILPRFKSTQATQTWCHPLCTSVIRELSANSVLYGHVDVADPEFVMLVESIQEKGLLEKPVITRDGYLLSGHRRLAAANCLDIERIDCEVRNVSYLDEPDECKRLLVEFNSHRTKSTETETREAIIRMPENGWNRMVDYMDDVAPLGEVEIVKLVGRKKRCKIRDKLTFRSHIISVVESLRSVWPISDRKVFYDLLNVWDLVRNDVTKTPYANDEESYSDVTDMVTRLRLDGSIPFHSIGDETRPVVVWNTHKSARTFVDEQLDNLLCGYWRDLLQSQPHHVELFVEKNTVAGSVRDIAEKYTLPMTSGRGYTSHSSIKQMVDRLKNSGKHKLIVVTVTDHDPEGMDIPHSLGLSLRDDYGVSANQLVIVRAALTNDHVRDLDLHEGQPVKRDTKKKRGSSRAPNYIAQFGEKCWELESLPVQTLKTIVEGVIREVLDLDRFLEEVDKEGGEQEELQEKRARIKELLSTEDLTS